MSKATFFCTAALLLPTSLLAQNADDIFKALDANGDGTISRDEVKSDKKAAFDRLLRSSDKNKDGKLTRDEFSGAAKEDDRPANVQGGIGRPGQDGGRRNGDPERFFQMLDRNKDGKVTLDEVPDQAKTRLKPIFERLGKDEITKEDLAKLRPNGAGKPKGNADEFFKRFDKNKDGKVALNEVPEQLRKRIAPLFERLGKKEITREEFAKFSQRAGGRKPGDKPEGGRQFDPSTIFDRMDKNGDGKLDGDEIPERLRARGGQVDANKDGAVSLEELKRAFSGRVGPSKKPGNR